MLNTNYVCLYILELYAIKMVTISMFQDRQVDHTRIDTNEVLDSIALAMGINQYYCNKDNTIDVSPSTQIGHMIECIRVWTHNDTYSIDIYAENKYKSLLIYNAVSNNNYPIRLLYPILGRVCIIDSSLLRLYNI